MAFTVVQHKKATTAMVTTTSSGVTGTFTWPQATAAGNLLVAAVTFRAPSGTTTASNAQGWTQANATQAANGIYAFDTIWYKANSAGSDPFPVFTLGNAANYYGLFVAEISGVATASPLDVTGLYNPGATATALALPVTVTAGSVTTAANEFMYAMLGGWQSSTHGSWTWSASTVAGGATLGADIDQGMTGGETNITHGWATTGASGTSPSWTFNGSANLCYGSGVIATFKAAPSGAPPKSGQFFTMFR
jgi:hypothetical protein